MVSHSPSEHSYQAKVGLKARPPWNVGWNLVWRKAWMESVCSVIIAPSWETSTFWPTPKRSRATSALITP